jgi:hypothetical protein
VAVTGKEIVIVTEEKETVVIVDVVTEAVKVGVGVPLLISVPPSAQRGTEVKAIFVDFPELFVLITIYFSPSNKIQKEKIPTHIFGMYFFQK